MRGNRGRASRTRSVLFATVLAGGSLPSPSPCAAPDGPSAAVDPAVTAWLEGDAARAARELLPRADREGRLNRGVALLYAGELAAAEQELAVLRAHEPRWTPALRWLARARGATASAKLEETLQELIAERGADSRDFLWAGRLLLDRREPGRAATCLREAVDREKDLYLGWLWLGDAEEAQGRGQRAREAWLQARNLHAGGDILLRLGENSLRAGRDDEGRRFLAEALATREGRLREEQIRRLLPDLPAPPKAPTIAPPLRAGERLRYNARYLFFTFATLEVVNQGWTEFRGRRASRLVFAMRSKPGFPFLSINSRFESLIAEDGSVLAHRSTSRDSTQTPRTAAYEMDPASSQCVVRQVVEGLFGFDRFPLPPLDQDGVSVLQLARGLARSPARVSVLTAVDSTWKGTALRTVGVERIRWSGTEVESVQVEAVGHYRGPAGLAGIVRAWISRDVRAVPYRATIKVALGSVVLDLEGGPGAAAD